MAETRRHNQPPHPAGGSLCAYCGVALTKSNRTTDHVIPKCLYPASKRTSKVQRLAVPACKPCNWSFQDDEPHFRDVLKVAGDPSVVIRENWQNARRSFGKADGRHRFFDLIEQMKPIDTADGPQHVVYPGGDEHCMRVIHKIIRGLCYSHRLPSPVPDQQVWANVLTYDVPPAFLEALPLHHREADVIEYRYAVLDNDDIHSAWLLTFFERARFIGLVWQPEP